MRTSWTWGVGLLSALVLVGGCKKGEEKKTTEAPAPKPTEPAAKPKVPEAPKALTAADKMKLFHECWAAFDSGDTERFKKCYGADGELTVVDSVPPMTGKGGEAAAGIMTAFRTAFPDLKHTMGFMAQDENTFAAFFVGQGTNSGEMMGMPATGKPVALWAAQLVTLDDQGVVVTDEHFLDGGTMMAQLGVSPNPMAPAAADVTPPETPIHVMTKDDATEQANLAALKALEEPMMAGEWDKVLAAYADDAEFRFMPDKNVMSGKKAIEKGMKDWLKMNTDMVPAVHSYWAAGDWVISRTSTKATMAIDMPGFPVKTKGKTYEQQMLEFMQFADGKIKKHWIFANQAKWAEAMGMPMGPPPTK